MDFAGVRMDDRNPYAPSRASLNRSGAPTGQVGSGVTAWRYRRMLVMVPDTALPDRCVKCNDPANAPTKARKLYWHHPGVYALILINIIVYAIVGAIVRKRAIVAPGLCVAHKKRRRLVVTFTWCAVGLGLASIVADLERDGGGVWLVIGLLMLLVSALAGFINGRIVHAHKIEKTQIWLKGCGQKFLDSLPDLPQA